MVYTFLDGLPMRTGGYWIQPRLRPLVACNQSILIREAGKVHSYLDGLINQM
jgi:hypothetical protein